MIFLILINWFGGILLTYGKDEYFVNNNERTRLQKSIFFTIVTINLCYLGYFKYANFIINNVNYFYLSLIEKPNAYINISEIALPIGISFYTFQALSYVIDIYMGKSKATNRLDDVACYISMFPQLIAGPIIRYNTISEQLYNRTTSFNQFSKGIRRFVVGLAKKILIANILGSAADAIFQLPFKELSTPVAWLGAISYTLQIYFDFSAYSDMAIGLGLILGFKFPENFNFPYVSTSVKEFWRRWHISLSTWFKDYLYIPLGGNKHGKWRTYTNLWIVFFLCGIWHGANWTFILWGIWHGIFIILERALFGKIIVRIPKLFSYSYTILIVIIGWVIFRCETVIDAWIFIKVMFGAEGSLSYVRSTSEFLSPQVLLLFNFWNFDFC